MSNREHDDDATRATTDDDFGTDLGTGDDGADATPEQAPEQASPAAPRPATHSTPMTEDEIDADVASVVIPSSLAADPHAPMPLFASEDYSAIATGSGAEKLRTSAIAPLVAAARGYDSATEDTLKEKTKQWGLGQTNSKEGRQLAKAVGADDALILPWYRPADVYRAARGLEAETVAGHAALQLRPRNPDRNDKGKEIKYRFLAGNATVVDIHPAIPAEWMEDDGVGVVLITEGTPKGDAALTAVLRNHGYTDDELRFTADPNIKDQRIAAAEKLRTMLSAIPVENRVLVINLGGVGNWHQHTEWNSIPLRGTDVWLAFDGDVGENPQVWNQANQMFAYLAKRGAAAVLLNLDVAAEQTGTDTDIDKVGLDDYLASYGNWASLEDRLEEDLPPRPTGKDTEYQVGQWRINGEDCTTEEYVEVPDANGGTRKTWEIRGEIIARVARVETRREMTREEEETGVFDEAASEAASGNCEIEMAWKDRNSGTTRKALLRGPDTLLLDPPKEWHRRGGTIPAAVGVHPDWPPRKGDEWMSAVKKYREDDTEKNMAWDHMGWVTAPSTTPVFIAGKTVIGPNGFSDAAKPGVGEDELPKATWFGCDLPDSEEQARADLKAVLDAYVHSGAWSDRRVAATVLATALRPCIPMPTRMSVFFVGPPRMGKSWSANSVMSFWQPKAGVWQDRLPGSAKDSAPAMINAVSRSLLWVADDLAPNASKAKAERESSALGDMFRVIHNGTPPARANADGSSRKQKHPRALFIATAENALSISSEMERVVLIQVQKGSLGTEAATQEVVNIRDTTGEACRVSGAVVQMLAQDIADVGWSKTRTFWEEMHESVAFDAKRVLGGTGTATRHAKISADVALGLVAGKRLAEKLNMGSEIEDLFDVLIADVHSLVSEHHSAQRETTPGRRILDAVRSILAAGHAHLSAPGQAGPPFVNDDNASNLNHMSGWSSGGDSTTRAGGPDIGYVVFPEDGEPIVLLNQTNAFTEARRLHEDLVPSGSSARTAWTSLWDEGLTSTKWARKKDTGRRLLSTVRTTVKGVSIEGVPVPISVLFGIAPEVEADEDDDVYIPSADVA